MLFLDGKSLFLEVKMTTNSFINELQQHWNHWWLYIKYKQKSMFGVTGDDLLVFPTKRLLYSVLIGYCLMENHFSEVKKTTNSFTNELQQHWNYGWLYMEYNQKSLFGVMIPWCFQSRYCYIQF